MHPVLFPRYGNAHSKVSANRREPPPAGTRTNRSIPLMDSAYDGGGGKDRSIPPFQNFTNLLFTNTLGGVV